MAIGAKSKAGAAKSRQGMIVALIGPDGVGKTYQTAELTKLFQGKGPCAAIYLGSGEGGWKLRGAARRLVGRWRRSRAAPTQPMNPNAIGREYGTSHSIFRVMSGLVIALERYATLRRAKRLAALGSLVICDRWPQNLQPGLFDGPQRVHPRASRTVRLLARLEAALYRRMGRCQPDLTFHLVSDFETSNARKPGDRSQADFDRRLLLMQRMRALDPAINVVDAGEGPEQVTKNLSDRIQLALAQRAGNPAGTHIELPISAPGM